MTYEEFKKFEIDLKEKFEFYEKERKKWFQIELINNNIERFDKYSIESVEIFFKNANDNHIVFIEDTNLLKELFIRFLELRKEKLINER